MYSCSPLSYITPTTTTDNGRPYRPPSLTPPVCFELTSQELPPKNENLRYATHPRHPDSRLPLLYNVNGPLLHVSRVACPSLFLFVYSREPHHPSSQPVRTQKKRHPLKPKPRVPQKTFRRNRKKKKKPRHKKMAAKSFLLPPLPPPRWGPLSSPTSRPGVLPTPLAKKGGYPKQPKPSRLRCALCACVCCFSRKKGDKKE